jgi:hypothetical protein
MNKNKQILEYSNNLIEELYLTQEIDSFLEYIVEEKTTKDFGIFLENLTVEEATEIYPDLEEINEGHFWDGFKSLGKFIWKLPTPLKAALGLGAGVALGAGAGSAAAVAMNPGHIAISGGVAGTAGGTLGALAGLAPFLAVASARCLKHLKNFLLCAYRAFTLHHDPAGTTKKGPDGSTIHNWTKREKGRYLW